MSPSVDVHCSSCLSVDVHLSVDTCVTVLFPPHSLSLTKCTVGACVTFLSVVKCVTWMETSIHSLKTFVSVVPCFRRFVC